MKKNISILGLIFCGIFTNAQFSIKVNPPATFSANEAYLYTTIGSKDILLDKTVKKNGTWTFDVKNNYFGLMKIYFPDSNNSLSLISENKDIELSFSSKNNKVDKIDYKDESNSIFYEIQDRQRKKEQILPAFYQILDYYKGDSTFGKALNTEIANLNTDMSYDTTKHPFINYYYNTYNKYLVESAVNKKPTTDEIANFISNSQSYLETSSLVRPLLLSYLSNTNKSSLNEEVDKLLNKVNIETPRGQVILSELIEIFNVYGMKDLKEKYITEAKNLKCTINERLSNTIKANTNTEIGKIIPNSKFINPINTTAKSLHDVKADKKIVIIWYSTCSHCEKEIGEMVTKYNELKAKNIEVVGFSIDTDAKSYNDKAKLLPWINDTELKGWHSSYVDTYNVYATPTFYIVDSKNKIIANPYNFSEILEFLQLK